MPAVVQEVLAAQLTLLHYPRMAVMEPKRDSVPPRPQYFPYRSVVIAASENGPPTKTGVRDGSVIFDQRWLQWVNRLLLALRHSQLEERIFKFDHPTAAKIFRKGATSLRLQGTTVYHARHSGASTDRAGQHRTLSEAQKGEQWVRQEQSGGRCSGTASPDKMLAGPARATCRGATSWQALKSGFHRRVRGHYILEVFGRDGDVCAATSRLGYRGHV